MAADGQYRRFVQAGFLADFRFYYTDNRTVTDNFLHDIHGDADLGEYFLFPGIGADIIKLGSCGKRENSVAFLPVKK